ncbi:MAG TPA: transaldolase [Alphaproteobacteria bacterium]|nr:transaldolase [Alphaproteobacteria bacterium]
MPKVDSLRIRLFLDGAELPAMKEAVASNPLIKGFTTNPTLMRKAGITDYAAFAKEAIAAVGERSISFEVFSDDFETMEREAREIHTWGGNTYVKIPVTNTKGVSSAGLIRKLSAEGIPLNVTAILTPAQVREVGAALAAKTPSIVSVFAGRIADSGVDPMPLMRECVGILRDRPRAELLWASPRELLNVFQAEEVGCHIITATKDVLAKLSLVGKDLTQYSLETVQMFYRDAHAAGYQLVPKLKATSAA